jgi:DNA-binding GntR family transcriptional regulator
LKAVFPSDPDFYMQYDQSGGVRTEGQDELPAAGHGRATQAAVDALRQLVLEGELAPGTRLSERAIRDRISVSRTPLREALKILAAEGLLVLEPNRGASVPRFGLEDLRAAYELLAALEEKAGELACQRASDAEIEAIAALHARMVERHAARDRPGYFALFKQVHLAVVGARPGYFALNKQVHLAIVDAGGNAAISRAYRAESARVDRFRYVGNRDPAAWSRAIRQHEQMVDALRQREPLLLRETLAAHRRTGWELARAQHAAERDAPAGA